jgi:hypothetical protein
MANLTELSQWENGIYQLETTDSVEAGAGGLSNEQARLLGNRTKWLYDRTDEKIFRGQISQSGGSSPSISVVKNNTGGSVSSFVRNSEGVYTMTTSFTIPALAIFRIQSTVLNATIYLSRTGANTLVFRVTTTNGSINLDGGMSNCPFEIIL